MTDYDPKISIYERVARIEQQVEHIDQAAQERYDHLKSVEKKLDDALTELQRYRGMVGAVLLVVTAITTFFKLFWKDIAHFVK
jgi:hypothetical protein